YVWTVSSGGTITAGGTATSNTVTVTWNTAVAQTVSVNYTNANGCTAATPSVYNVTVNALPVPTITGPQTLCAGTTGNVYTTQAGMSGYTWSVSAGGMITAGTGTNAITVTWNTSGAQTVIVNYTNTNGCTAASPTIYNVTVNPLPVPVISGPSSVCLNSTGNVYTAQTGMTNYVWTVSAGGTVTAGGTSTSNFVTVTWTTVGAKTISVNYANAFGCTAAAPTVLNVTVNALPVPTISGETSNICPGSGWTPYTTQYGMSNYVWTVSAGGIIASGQGTAQVQVYWSSAGAQWVAAGYSNASGCTSATPTQLNVTVSSLPAAAGTITGTATVCAGAQGVAYSVAPITNATSYNWFLPTGVTIASGAGTNSITVNYPANAVSGGISVNGNNSCGNGITSPPYQVTINPVPAAGGGISGKAKVCSGTTGVLYSVGAIANATSYVWTVPSGVVITAGSATRTITVTFTNTARSGNFIVHGTNACGSGANSPPYYVTVSSPPPNPQITPSSLGPEIRVGDVLISSVTEGNQWYLDDQPIAGATDQTLVIPSIGTYYVIASIGSCSSEKSNDILVGTTGLENKGGASFVVYPVPNYGLFTASVTTTYQESFRIVIYNTLGVMVHRTEEFKVQGKHEEQIDVRNLPSGIYSVVFTNDQRKVVRKIFINK
ncbi:MAG: T9SS type A sorting domain-containing protein, partial [Bacteroidetes bacterium]|nr:T9SS type A sorting domain-containing protein [Bacteroidota bacterium]